MIRFNYTFDQIVKNSSRSEQGKKRFCDYRNDFTGVEIIDEEVHVNNRHATSRNAFYIDVGKRREKVINSRPLSHGKNCGRKIENGTERVCHLCCGEWSFFIVITDVKLPNFYSGYKKFGTYLYFPMNRSSFYQVICVSLS